MDKVEVNLDYFTELGFRINLPEYEIDSSGDTHPIFRLSLNKDNIAHLKDTIRQTLQDQHLLILTVAPGLFKTPSALAEWQSTILGPIKTQQDQHHFKIELTQNPASYVVSNLSQPLHCDEGYSHDYPSIISLYCQNSAAHGGLSILVLFEKLFDALKLQFKDDINLLFDPKAITVDCVLGLVEKPLLLKLKDGSIGISYSALIKGITCSKKVFEMFDFITEYVHNPVHQIRFKLHPNELLIFNNCTVIHGRTGFRTEDKRRLFRFWFRGWE